MRQRRTSRRKRWLISFLLVFFVAAYVGWTLVRPLSSIAPVTASLPAHQSSSKLAWPTSQAAVGVVGSPILETRGQQTPLPIASAAKIITCLVALDAKPLKAGEQGPLVNMTPNDVAIYNNYVAQDGSVMKVQAGVPLSQYQMLQAIMLPSANNVADSLVIWAFGSLEAYNTAATAYLSSHGLRNTHVGSDASGLAPTTTSTAEDLVKLGKLAMENPVLAEIVGQSTVTNMPVAGTIKNVNFLLGSHNIIGLKTGNTDQAGGVYVSAARVQIDNKPVTIVTALVGAPNLLAAMQTSLPLIDSAQKNFQPVEIVKKGAVVGRYALPWGGTINATAAADLKTPLWNGGSASATVKLRAIHPENSSGQNVGSVVAAKSSLFASESVAIKLEQPVTKPTIWWRLSHPIQ